MVTSFPLPSSIMEGNAVRKRCLECTAQEKDKELERRKKDERKRRMKWSWQRNFVSWHLMRLCGEKYLFTQTWTAKWRKSRCTNGRCWQTCGHRENRSCKGKNQQRMITGSLWQQQQQQQQTTQVEMDLEKRLERESSEGDRIVESSSSKKKKETPIKKPGQSGAHGGGGQHMGAGGGERGKRKQKQMMMNGEMNWMNDAFSLLNKANQSPPFYKSQSKHAHQKKILTWHGNYRCGQCWNHSRAAKSHDVEQRETKERKNKQERKKARKQKKVLQEWFLWYFTIIIQIQLFVYLFLLALCCWTTDESWNLSRGRATSPSARNTKANFHPLSLSLPPTHTHTHTHTHTPAPLVDGIDQNGLSAPRHLPFTPSRHTRNQAGGKGEGNQRKNKQKENRDNNQSKRK